MLEEQLSARIGVPFKYQKNSKEMFSILNQYGSQDLAIKNAKKLESSGTTKKTTPTTNQEQKCTN